MCMCIYTYYTYIYLKGQIDKCGIILIMVDKGIHCIILFWCMSEMLECTMTESHGNLTSKLS